jgi:hypothetical protein
VTLKSWVQAMVNASTGCERHDADQSCIPSP